MESRRRGAATPTRQFEERVDRLAQGLRAAGLHRRPAEPGLVGS
jgi:hypothetical protein